MPIALFLLRKKTFAKHNLSVFCREKKNINVYILHICIYFFICILDRRSVDVRINIFFYENLSLNPFILSRYKIISC